MHDRGKSADSPSLPTILPAIILCGGRSTRMGTDKLRLPLAGGTLYSRVEDVFAAIATHLVVVIGPFANPPESHRRPIIVRDEQAELGPLEGLRVGLREATGLGAEMAMVATGDAPLAVPALYQFMVEELVGAPDLDAVVPFVGDNLYPLTAVYRTRVLKEVELRVGQGKLKARELAAALNIRRLTADALTKYDPELQTLRNINTPEDYERVLGESEAQASEHGGTSCQLVDDTSPKRRNS